MSNTRMNCRRGFTFIEIMMVVVIIGILLALVGPRLAGRTKTARIAATNAQISNFGTALQAYEMDMGTYPDNTAGLAALVTKPSGDEADGWGGPYLKGAVPKDSWGQAFNYRFPGEHNTDDFDLWSNGPDRTTGTDDDVVNWSRESK